MKIDSNNKNWLSFRFFPYIENDKCIFMVKFENKYVRITKNLKCNFYFCQLIVAKDNRHFMYCMLLSTKRIGNQVILEPYISTNNHEQAVKEFMEA